MLDSITDWLEESSRLFWGFVSGAITAIIGFFLPVRDIVHLLILFFVIDVIFGYWAAKKLRGERFSAKIIWKTTMPRMVISLVLILGSFMWDNVYHQTYVATYRIIGWFITGVLFFSIMQNAYYATNWQMIPLMGKLLSDKMKMDFKEKTEDEKN